jgi:carbamate kinase
MARGAMTEVSPLVAGIGGHALGARDAGLDVHAMRTAAAEAARSLAPLADPHRLVITHGNGPQVGRLAMESALAARELGGERRPIDVLDAETEGVMGYLLEQALRDALPAAEFATVLTQVVVDPDDPAFDAPVKPIGPVMPRTEADRLVEQQGWTVGPVDGGRRRLIASPDPASVLAVPAVRALIDAGLHVICGGGGGIPVTRTRDGLRGVEAVIDKDTVTAAVAIELKASGLLLLTDVDAVYEGWRTPDQRPIRQIAAADLDPDGFEAGSMRPKVAAARRFVRITGQPAVITSMTSATAAWLGDGGTRITPA